MVEHQPINRGVTGLIPGQGTFPCCGFSPCRGVCERQPIEVSLSHQCFSTFLFPFPSLKSINKFFLKSSASGFVRPKVPQLKDSQFRSHSRDGQRLTGAVRMPVHHAWRNTPRGRSGKAQFPLESPEPVDLGNKGSDEQKQLPFPKSGHTEWYNR